MALMIDIPLRSRQAGTRRPFPTSVALLVCWTAAFSTTLLGYAIFGRGWAYVGVSPLFIGDAVLLAGVGVLLTCTSWWTILEVPVAWPLLGLMVWGTLRTLPFVSRYGVDALRDAVIWGYGAYAFIVFGCLVASPALLCRLVRQYGRFARIFIVLTPLVGIVSMFAGQSLPRWPGTSVPIIHVKPGDTLVHLAAILTCWTTGLGGRVATPLILLYTADLGMMGIQSRGGLMAYLASTLLCVLDRPQARALRGIAVAVICGIVVLVVADVRVQVPGRERAISFDQFLENMASLSSESKSGDLDGTKQWRLNWWSTIVDYTVHGEHFWKGKGFGVNLADDDGFQVEADGSLRSPHNGHLSVLARAGVPGLVLWTLVHLGWMACVFGAYVKCRLRGQDDWAGLFLVLLVYALAMLINATFDVFMEGPVGGIWYWSIYGVGLAGLWIHRRNPEMTLRLEGAPVRLRDQSHPSDCDD